MIHHSSIINYNQKLSLELEFKKGGGGGGEEKDNPKEFFYEFLKLFRKQKRKIFFPPPPNFLKIRRRSAKKIFLKKWLFKKSLTHTHFKIFQKVTFYQRIVTIFIFLLRFPAVSGILKNQ